MIILALDLGTTTGWALFRDGERLDSGEWDLKPLVGRGERWKRFEKKLRDAIRWAQQFSVETGVDFTVVAEDGGSFHTNAARVHNGLRALLELECFKRDIDQHYVAIKTIKKHATGNGNAKKPEMIAAAGAKWGCTAEHEADALWVGETYMAQNV